MTAKPVYIQIPNRGLITVSGHDSFHFLQGLITNDIRLLETQKAIYTCLLTPNGKFLFDFFVIRDGENLLLECEGGHRAQDLLKRLQIFKLRADVSFHIEDKKGIYAVFHSKVDFADPRHPEMGHRSFSRPDNMEEAAFDLWDTKRIKLGIADGSRDMIPEKSTLLECNIDQFNGVSFDKGCYMGQELTARMHYRGLTKKTLLPLEFTGTPPAPLTDLKDQDDQLIGEMRSSCAQFGLALLKKSNLSFVSDEYKLYS